MLWKAPTSSSSAAASAASIAAYHLAAGGAKVTVLERGPWLTGKDFDHDYLLGKSYTRVFDFVAGDGMSVLGGNCVGGGSVVYFAALPRAPRFVFERHGSIGRRMWPAAINRDSLDPWYDRVSEVMPVSQQDWNDVTYAGGLWAAACHHSGHTANPVPVGVDNTKCTNCNWMMAGCRFDAKQSLLLNYLPAALVARRRRSARCTRCRRSRAPTTAATACTSTPSTRRTTGSAPAAAPSTPRSSCSPRAPARPR